MYDGEFMSGKENIFRPVTEAPILAGKRIIIVLPNLMLGGSERQALLLAHYLLHEQQAQVEVWALSRLMGRVVDVCEAENIPWRIVPMTWPADRLMRFKAWIKLALTLRQSRPDVILPYAMRANVVCGQVWRLTGAQLCIWNQRDEGRSANVSRPFQRWAARQVPWFISNSWHGKEFLIQSLGVKADKVQVINNGIELAKPKADRATWRNQLEVDEDCILACMVARIHLIKDHATLLKAWRQVIDRLAESGPPAVLLLAGRFADAYEPLQALAAELELGQTIRFLGEVEDISGLLSAVDLGVFSSLYEGVPNGVLECMAAGLAIAGTDSPGICEAVGPDGYPFLAPPGDAETLADRILQLVLNPELRAKVGVANHCRIEQEFRPRRMCEETVALIRRGLENNSKQRG